MKIKNLIFLLVISLFSQTFAQEKNPENDGNTEYPEKRKGRETWEYIVNIPGYICLLPVWALDAALVPVSYAITETKVIEKTVDFLTSDDGKRGVFPTYEARTGAGLNFYQKGLIQEGTDLQITATVWASARQSFQLYFNDLKLIGPVNTSLSAMFFKYTDEPFFGIGNNLDYDFESHFLLKQYQANIEFGIDLGKNNAITFHSGWEHNQVSEEDNDNYEKGEDDYLFSTVYSRFSNSYVPVTDVFDKTRLVHGELKFKHDSRNVVGNPSSGWELYLNGGLYKQTDGSQYGFYRGTADVTKYIHLFYNRVLAFRAAGQITTSYDGGEIPFYYLAELGQRTTIRGYERGRFREKDKLLGSVEYRFPILKRFRPEREAGSLDMVLFVDSGKVAPDIKDNITDNYHTTWGFGLRFYNSKSLMMQFYTGFSDDGVRLYYVLN